MLYGVRMAYRGRHILYLYLMSSPRKASRELLRLVLTSLACGLLATVLGLTLKHATEKSEQYLSARAMERPALYFLLPLAGFSLIYLLRQRLFHKKQNKGIKEIFDALKNRAAKLPFFKIPSHYINGLITVASGGATGIEVSTVVATATIGSIAHQKAQVHGTFRREMICAAVAAGVTVLFGSPLAGILFSYEVISRRWNKFAFLSIVVAAGSSWLGLHLLEEDPLFQIRAGHWHLYALPLFILLALLSALQSVYLTRCVLFFKNTLGSLQNPWYRIGIAALGLGLCLMQFPELYGDGYAGMRPLLGSEMAYSYPLGIAVCILLLKAPVTALSLAGGGDGGVFAPSLFIGAFLGYICALLCRFYGHLDVVPVNFVLVGMAAVLSGSLHAPLTAAFLVLGLTGNYGLLIPLLLSAYIAKVCAQRVFPFTVYTYQKPSPVLPRL